MLSHYQSKMGMFRLAECGPVHGHDNSEIGITSNASENDPMVVHSLLDGPSVAGAFRFAISRTEGTVMEIENHLFARRDIERLGIAPLTSMYWYSEYGRERLAEGRPEVHDADGLVIWNGAGERLFRALNSGQADLAHPATSTTSREGFGLTQRDRNFDHYLDGVGYEKRPCAGRAPGGLGQGTGPAGRDPDG